MNDINKKPFKSRPWSAETDTSNTPDQDTPDINNITASGVTLSVRFAAIHLQPCENKNQRIYDLENMVQEKDRIVAGLELTFHHHRGEIAALKNRLVDLDRSNTDLQHKLGECGERNRELKIDYERACQTVALMHAAALGEVTGPRRGVVEDVEDLRLEKVRLQGALHSAEQRNFVYGELVTNLAKALGMGTFEISLNEVRERVTRLVGERNNWEQTAAQHLRNEQFYRDLLGQCAKMLGDGCRRQDDGGMVPEDDFLALRVPEVLSSTLERSRKIEAVHNTRIACAWGLFGIGGPFRDALTIGQDVVMDGMKWMADTIKNHHTKLNSTEALLDTERELRRAAEQNMTNLLDFAAGRSSTVPLSGSAVPIRNEIIRLRKLADSKPCVRELVATTLGKATNEILKGLSEPQIEPQYRMLVVGEVIEEGDEYFDNFEWRASAWRASACAGDTFHPTVGGGKHYPHRRKITP